MAHTKIIVGLLVGMGLAVSGCGGSTDPESVCSACPEAAREICVQGVQNCLDIGGPFADECVDAIVRACRGD